MDRLPIIGRSRVVRDHGNIFCAPNDLVRSFLTNFPILFFRYLRARVEPISRILDTECAEVSTTADLKQIAGKLATAWEQRRLSLAQIKHLGVPGRASLLQDAIKGRQSEIKELNGLVVHKGKQVDIVTPMNQAVVQLMNALQKGEIIPEPANTDRLKPHILYEQLNIKRTL